MNTRCIYETAKKKQQLVHAFQRMTCLVLLFEKGGELFICIFLCIAYIAYKMFRWLNEKSEEWATFLTILLIDH